MSPYSAAATAGLKASAGRVVFDLHKPGMAGMGIAVLGDGQRQDVGNAVHIRQADQRRFRLGKAPGADMRPLHQPDRR